MNDKKEIANIEELKIFIGIEKFFSINEIEAKDLIFNNVEFNIDKGDVSFFSELLKTAPNENKIEFKNSNIFFRNKAEEILSKKYDIIKVKVDEIAKFDAGLSCMSLRW